MKALSGENPTTNNKYGFQEAINSIFFLMDYFSLFDLPISYEIDTKVLAERFYNLQRQYHPDKFVNKAREEKLFAVMRSATINQAWKILRNPLTRAEYFLSLKGIDVTSGKNTMQSPGFLTKQLELREELDDIVQEKDAIQLKNFVKKVENIFDITYKKMVRELNKGTWGAAADTLNKLRFLNRLRCRAEDCLEYVA